MYVREFERASSRFVISASLNPNDGSACMDRALALALLGEQGAADETAEIAAILNPLGGEWFSAVRAIVHFMARRYEAAEECLSLGPRTWPDMLAFHAANRTYLGDQRKRRSSCARLWRVRAMWWGPAPMQPQDFIDWFYHIICCGVEKTGSISMEACRRLN